VSRSKEKKPKSPVRTSRSKGTSGDYGGKRVSAGRSENREDHGTPGEGEMIKRGELKGQRISRRTDFETFWLTKNRRKTAGNEEDKI